MVMESDDRLDLYVEALIFAVDSPITIEEIAQAINTSFGQEFEKSFFERLIERIEEKYQGEEHVMTLQTIAHGYQFMTKPIYHHVIGNFLKQSEKKKLSRSALETLSIIAYKQPITKSEVESIRGVNCDYTIQKLMEKELVSIIGRRDTPGRPLTYGTSAKFLDHFGIKDMKALPNLNEFELVEDMIGNPEEN